MQINDNQQTITPCYIPIAEQQIPVTKEVYRAFKRPAWAERKRKEREKRCRDENGNRCTKSCRVCDLERAKKGLPPIERTGSVLSLDKFTEEGFEVADPVDIAELVADKLLLEELYAALEELDPDNRRIMELFGIGKSEREIAADIGLSQKAINKRKTKLFAQLRERLKDFI
ncbi:sigma factor-like helix-turn-helix DNA-binding protein [Paradesulfitobacterium ferrireducens]|uniref:sigma factor-like helix-turn-helix DNA-binding protein n=1 Tax=Paradesulfitobacterium ferrireducens TaxID=2816476 RepID=UPI001A8D9C0F|nr:sigma factor-like helix-turn-helix DNA-binding protein [Paradesulfitobacterium ferrireducens]